MKSLKPLVLTTLALLLTDGAGAQTVYRCGNSYSQSPCAHAVAVPTDDPRTEDQRAAAQEGLAHDKALAKEMEAARRRDQAQTLVQDKLALARATAAHKKQDTKRVTSKKASSAKARTARVTDAEFFTATDGSQKKKPNAKAAQP